MPASEDRIMKSMLQYLTHGICPVQFENNQNTTKRTFRPSVDHQLHFFEQGSALGKHKGPLLLHYNQEYT